MARILLQPEARKAVLIGSLCSLSYLAVYIARNILGTVSPQIEAEGIFSKEIIGTLSSIYFTCYACGQLVNGLIGDRVKAKYMISFGLALAGICNLLFPLLTSSVMTVYVVTVPRLSGLYELYGRFHRLERSDPCMVWSDGHRCHCCPAL